MPRSFVRRGTLIKIVSCVGNSENLGENSGILIVPKARMIRRHEANGSGKFKHAFHIVRESRSLGVYTVKIHTSQMSPCLSWGYFLKKLGIRRKRTLSIDADAPTAASGGERQREDSPEMPNVAPEVRQMHENNKYDVSLLHPNWRRFPHAPLYGWTNDHAQQLKSLNDMIINGSLESAYYNSDAEYRAAYFINHYAILPPPNVSDINEAVLLLRRNQGFQNNSCCNESLVEYDADDESENKPGLQRYYNHHRPRRHVGQRTVV